MARARGRVTGVSVARVGDGSKHSEGGRQGWATGVSMVRAGDRSDRGEGGREAGHESVRETGRA